VTEEICNKIKLLYLRNYSSESNLQSGVVLCGQTDGDEKDNTHI
jgi:hypothetical protein